MECHSCHQKGHFARECPTNAMEGRSGDGGISHGGKRTIPPWTDRGELGQLPRRYGIRGVHSGCADLEEVGSCGGRANQVLGAAVLSGGMSARVPGQSETYRDSGNSGHKMELHSGGNRRRRRNIGISGTRKEHMGERLPCTIRSVTEVRAVTEETLAVRAVGLATLAPYTVTQVQVIVPTPRARGTVMIEPGPGPLGLCPVRGVIEVEQDSSIWISGAGGPTSY